MKEHADIHALNDDGFQLACRMGYLKIVQYLLTSPELKEHADIHANNDNGFQLACRMGHLQIVQFFIFDMNIEKTEYINKYLRKNPNGEIDKMFTLRDLNISLQTALDNKNNINKRVKI